LDGCTPDKRIMRVGFSKDFCRLIYALTSANQQIEIIEDILRCRSDSPISPYAGRLLIGEAEECLSGLTEVYRRKCEELRATNHGELAECYENLWDSTFKRLLEAKNETVRRVNAWEVRN